MHLGIAIADSVWSPALAKSLVELLARVDLAYLTALDGLPCCPKCAGIRRRESFNLMDVAQLIRCGAGNSLSLAAWQLAEAWKDGVEGAFVEVTDPAANTVDFTEFGSTDDPIKQARKSKMPTYGYVIHKRDNLIDIAEHYMLASGCGCG